MFSFPHVSILSDSTGEYFRLMILNSLECLLIKEGYLEKSFREYIKIKSLLYSSKPHVHRYLLLCDIDMHFI